MMVISIRSHTTGVFSIVVRVQGSSEFFRFPRTTLQQAVDSFPFSRDAFLTKRGIEDGDELSLLLAKKGKLQTDSFEIREVK